VKADVSAMATSPSNNSPLPVVVVFPLFGDVLVPVAEAVTSREFEAATPEYSRRSKRKGPETVIVTVIVLAPALIFSA